MRDTHASGNATSGNATSGNATDPVRGRISGTRPQLSGSRFNCAVETGEVTSRFRFVNRLRYLFLYPRRVGHAR